MCSFGCASATARGRSTTRTFCQSCRTEAQLLSSSLQPRRRACLILLSLSFALLEECSSRGASASATEDAQLHALFADPEDVDVLVGGDANRVPQELEIESSSRDESLQDDVLRAFREDPRAGAPPDRDYWGGTPLRRDLARVLERMRLNLQKTQC